MDGPEVSTGNKCDNILLRQIGKKLNLLSRVLLMLLIHWRENFDNIYIRFVLKYKISIKYFIHNS